MTFHWRVWVGEDSRLTVDHQGHDGHPAMTEVDEVLGGGARTRPVIDVDARHSRHRILIDHDEGELATEQPAATDRLGLTRVDERAVDGDIAGGDHVAAPTVRGQQRQRQSGLGQLVGNGGEEPRRHLIGEGVRQRVGEQHANGARGATREGSGRRVRSDVAELGCSVEDALAQLHGELIRAREGVGHRHPADAEPVGDRLQCHPRHLAR